DEWEGCDALAVRRVEDDEPRRLPDAHEQAMTALVERHGIVLCEIGERNPHHDGTLLAIDDRDLVAVREVDEDARALLLEPERLRVRSERNARDQLHGRGIDHAERAFTVSQVDLRLGHGPAPVLPLAPFPHPPLLV